jgi:hypothetical protein
LVGEFLAYREGVREHRSLLQHGVALEQILKLVLLLMLKMRSISIMQARFMRAWHVSEYRGPDH